MIPSKLFERLVHLGYHCVLLNTSLFPDRPGYTKEDFAPDMEYIQGRSYGLLGGYPRIENDKFVITKFVDIDVKRLVNNDYSSTDDETIITKEDKKYAISKNAIEIVDGIVEALRNKPVYLARTPTKGAHIGFLTPDEIGQGTDIFTHEKNSGLTIDIRTEKGLVRAIGSGYEIIQIPDNLLEINSIAEFVQDFGFEYTKKNLKVEKTIFESNYDYDELLKGCFTQGNRRVSLNSLYCKGRINGLSHGDAAELYKKINATCIPPLDLKEVEYNIQHVQDYYATNIKSKNNNTKQFPKVTVNEALQSHHITENVSVTGMVVGKFELYNEVIKGVYKCTNNHITYISQIEGIDQRFPNECSNPDCISKELFLVPEKSIMRTARRIILKSQEDFSISQEVLTVKLTRNLVNAVEIGDLITIEGKIHMMLTGKKNSGVYRNYLLTKNVSQLNTVDTTLSSEDIIKFKKFPTNENFYQIMINSVASSIAGFNQIKESILLQQVGSPDILHRDGNITIGTINIGLWGHGGLAKSRITEWVERKLPKIKIIASMGATGKGLLLGIESDGFGGKSLHAGAFVYCNNGGTVIIEEYPRLPQEVTSELLTALASGYTSIAKAGFQAKVKANASLIATGNAKEGEWDESMSLVENLQTTSPHLQRIDLHWIILDKHSEDVDRKISDAMLFDTKYTPDVSPLSSEELVKYIYYVRQINPTIPDVVKFYLQNAYLSLRKDNQNNTISPRNLNTLMKLTMASARLYQRDLCDVIDADNAISLIQKMFGGQNISISELDTYISRQTKRCIKILKTSRENLSTEQLFMELKRYGSKEEQSQFKVDLGDEHSTHKNFKWRTVINKLRRSSSIVVTQEKPLRVSYNLKTDQITGYFE